jgi:hypothetical protein
VNLHADVIPVRHPQGSAHGFLSLKTLDGIRIATGDVTPIVHGDRVTSRVVFRFRDGSIDDDITFSSQRGTFRLISDHHIQRGPSFPKPKRHFYRRIDWADYLSHKDGKIRLLCFCLRSCRFACCPRDLGLLFWSNPFLGAELTKIFANRYGSRPTVYPGGMVKDNVNRSPPSSEPKIVIPSSGH